LLPSLGEFLQRPNLTFQIRNKFIERGGFVARRLQIKRQSRDFGFLFAEPPSVAGIRGDPVVSIRRRTSRSINNHHTAILRKLARQPILLVARQPRNRVPRVLVPPRRRPRVQPFRFLQINLNPHPGFVKIAQVEHGVDVPVQGGCDCYTKRG
jgi:hypothetical protein